MLRTCYAFLGTEQKTTYRDVTVLSTLILRLLCCMSAQRTAVALQLVKQLTPFASRSTPGAFGSDPAVIASSLCRAAQLLVDRASEPPGWSRGCVLHNMCLDRITTSAAPETGIERCGFAGFTVRSKDRYTSRTPQPFLHRTLHLSGLLCISRLCLHAQLQHLRLIYHMVLNSNMLSMQQRNQLMPTQKSWLIFHLFFSMQSSAWASKVHCHKPDSCDFFSVAFLCIWLFHSMADDVVCRQST